jgi:serine/threonine-protein kinase
MEICMKHAREAPEPPSARSGKPIDPGLEALLLRCLAKAPAERPANAADLLVELELCTLGGQWTSADAVHWWDRQEKAGAFGGENQEKTRLQETPAPEATVAFREPGTEK